MLTWGSMEEWYGQLCSAVHLAAQQFESKAVGVARRIATDQRIPGLNERTFLNNLTPTTQSHHLKLEELWHLLDVTGAKHPVHTVARQLDQLVAPIPAPGSVSMPALFGAFSERKREITETQELVYSVLEKRQPFSSVAARENLLREVYEDFCESISILLKLQTITPDLENVDHCMRNEGHGTRLAHCTGVVSAFIAQHAEALVRDAVFSASMAERFRNPEESKRLPIKRFIQLLEWDPSGVPFEAFLESLGFKSFPLPSLFWEATYTNLMDAYAELEQRQAETISRIRAALEDGVVTADQLSSIQAELEEEYQAEVTLVMSLPIINSPRDA